MHKYLYWIWVLFLAMTIGVGLLWAKTPSQPESQAIANTEQPIEFSPGLGQYHYEIRWGPKRVAKVTISIERQGEEYALRVDQKSTKFIDRMYRVRYRGETRINAADLSPVESVIEEEVKRRKKVQKAEYDSETGSVTVTETRSRRNRSDEKTKVYELRSDTEIVDLFSAIFLAQSLDWQEGERHTFTVFIGPKLYQVALDCLGQRTYKLGDKTIPVWVIRPAIKKTTEKKASPLHKNTKLYLSADETNALVKIKSELGIGTVKFRLVRHQRDEDHVKR